MLGVNVKLPFAVDLVEPVCDYIKANYSKEEAQQCREAMQRVQKQREAMRVALEHANADLRGALEQSQQYLAALHVLATRFPFGQSKGSLFRKGRAAVAANFNWSESFRQGKRALAADANFERAAVLFNLGALHTLIAIREDRSQVEGLKTACKAFQAAAGVFNYLLSRPELDLPLLGLDTSVDTYRLLHHTSLAQAQACYFEMALLQKLSAATVAKLARGTADLFQHAFRVAEKPHMKAYLAQTRYPYPRHMLFQCNAYLAAADLFQARAVLEKKQYGHEVAHLERARALLAEAKRLEAELVQGVVVARNRTADAVHMRLLEATKDNDSIYHFAVPSAAELPQIEAKLAVQETPFDPEPPRERVAELAAPFARLVPVKVHEAAALHKQQLAAMLTELKRECDAGTEYARAHLASLNLPGALEAVQPDAASGLPPSLWARVREAQVKGGLDALVKLKAAVDDGAALAWRSLKEVRAQIEAERKEDHALREKYGAARWNCAPATQLTAGFQAEADTVAQYLESARNSDQ